MFHCHTMKAGQNRRVALSLLATLLAVFSSMSVVHAQPGMDMLANMDPAQLRQALMQFPGVTSGCVDKLIEQLTSCQGYFDEINRLFPDLQAANGNQLLSYVMNNRPQGTCCEAIAAYNSARCICEQGILPMVRQFPERYWGLLEAGRCPAMTGQVVTPAMC